MEHGGEVLGFHENDIHNTLPENFKACFKLEKYENGNRAEREFATLGQLKRHENGGFGFGYHRDYENGSALFVERWIPSKPPIIDNWIELEKLASNKNWEIFESPREAATSILIKLEQDMIEEVIDSIISFLDTISKQEKKMAFLAAVNCGHY